MGPGHRELSAPLGAETLGTWRPLRALVPQALSQEGVFGALCRNKEGRDAPRVLESHAPAT